MNKGDKYRVKVLGTWYDVTVKKDDHVHEPFFVTKTGNHIFLFECEEIVRNPIESKFFKQTH